MKATTHTTTTLPQARGAAARARRPALDAGAESALEKLTAEPDLAALLADPTRAAHVPLDQVPGLLAALDAEQAGRTTLRALLLARLTPPAPVVAATLDDDDLLTDEDVGRMLSVPASCVADLRKAGELAGRPVGEKYIRTRRGDVRAYVARLPNVTYSRRHDRRGSAGDAQAARSHPDRVGRTGGGGSEQRGAMGAGGDGGA